MSRVAFGARRRSTKPWAVDAVDDLSPDLRLGPVPRYRLLDLSILFDCLDRHENSHAFYSIQCDFGHGESSLAVSRLVRSGGGRKEFPSPQLAHGPFRGRHVAVS
jgi:hypothetical protein